MFNFIKVPSAVSIATRDLESAKRELLMMQARAEHSVKMVEYYQELVKRLTKYVQNESKAVSE